MPEERSRPARCRVIGLSCIARGFTPPGRPRLSSSLGVLVHPSESDEWLLCCRSRCGLLGSCRESGSSRPAAKEKEDEQERRNGDRLGTTPLEWNNPRIQSRRR